MSNNNNTGSFKRAIETMAGAFTELQNSIDTLRETKMEIQFRVKTHQYLPLNIPNGEIGTMYMPLLL
jgi:hypothetical protein